MAHYRLYFLGEKGEVEYGIDLDCDDDAAALATAQRCADGRMMELRRGQIFIRRLAASRRRPHPPAPSSSPPAQQRAQPRPPGELRIVPLEPDRQGDRQAVVGRIAGDADA
jgi:hypothetical protein